MKKLLGCFLVLMALVITSCEKENAPGKGHLKDRVSRAVDSCVTKGLLPGVTVYVSNPSSSFTVYKGFSNIESETNWQAPLPGYAQSISKSFTATAILQLQERGKLKLDDAIKNYLDKDIYEKIANGTTITIRQLLNHTSGVFDYLEHPDFAADVFSGNIFPYDFRKSLLYVYNQPSLFSPGTDWSYSNTNYLLLALIIDKAAGISNGQFIKANIIDKLKLKCTFYLPYETASVPVVNTYIFNESTKSFDDVSDLQYALTTGMIGDDGIVTTPDDLGKFYKKLFETTDLISEKSKKEMLQFVSDGGQPKYGLGIMYRGVNKMVDGWGHSGAGLGAGAEATYFPATRTMIVLMTNAGVVLEGPAADSFEDLYQEIVAIVATR